MANAVMQTGRSNGTRGDNYDYAFKVSSVRSVVRVCIQNLPETIRCTVSEWLGVCCLRLFIPMCFLQDFRFQLTRVFQLLVLVS